MTSQETPVRRKTSSFHTEAVILDARVFKSLSIFNDSLDSPKRTLQLLPISSFKKSLFHFLWSTSRTLLPFAKMTKAHVA